MKATRRGFLKGLLALPGVWLVARPFHVIGSARRVSAPSGEGVGAILVAGRVHFIDVHNPKLNAYMPAGTRFPQRIIFRELVCIGEWGREYHPTYWAGNHLGGNYDDETKDLRFESWKEAQEWLIQDPINQTLGETNGMREVPVPYRTYFTRSWIHRKSYRASLAREREAEIRHAMAKVQLGRDPKRPSWLP